jgi:cytochrome c oxidase assembly factor CtaG
MFDNSTRSLGQASAAASNWFWNFIISRFTPQMFNTMGPSGCGVYFFFASMMIVSIIFVWFLVPESKHQQLKRPYRLTFMLTRDQQNLLLSNRWIASSRHALSIRPTRSLLLKIRLGIESLGRMPMVQD